MKPYKVVLCGVILALLVGGCDDDDNPVGPYPPIAVSGEIISYHCAGMGGYTHLPVDATVEIIDSTGYSFFVPVKDTGWFWTRVYPRRYTIVVETANTWPDTFENVDIQADTMLALYVSDDFDYTDKLDFCFWYRADSLGEARELEMIGEINRLTDSIFLPLEATREVIDFSFGVIVIYGVPVREEYRVWYAYNAVRKIINEELLELPPDFYVDPGSFICLD